MTDHESDFCRRPDPKALGALLLTGAAVILEPISGVTGLLARFAAMGSFGLADAQIAGLGRRTDRLETRMRALEASGLPVRRLGGPQFHLLGYCVLREAEELFAWAPSGEAMEALGLQALDYREAVEELEELGLVQGDVNLNDPSGFARARLCPIAYLAAGPVILHHIDLPAEFGAVLSQINAGGSDRIATSLILQRTGIHPPRLDLMLRALEDLGHIRRGGSGEAGIGSAMYQEVTPRGRRMLRGDDPISWGALL
jgi:hypothetical protein